MKPHKVCTILKSYASFLEIICPFVLLNCEKTKSYEALVFGSETCQFWQLVSSSAYDCCTYGVA
jgi:hypothetical protein